MNCWRLLSYMMHSIYMYILCFAMEMSMLFNTVYMFYYDAMSMLFNTETLAKGERLQKCSERIISLTNTTVDMELSFNAHRNEKCGYKLHTQTS